MKELFFLSTLLFIFVLVTAFKTPVMRGSVARVPAPKVAIFQKKTSKFLHNF